MGAEHSGGLFTAAGNGAAVRIAAAAGVAAVMGRAGRRVRRGGVPAGADAAEASAMPVGIGAGAGTVCFSRTVAAGGAVLSAGRWAGGRCTGTGTGRRFTAGSGAESLLRRCELACPVGDVRRRVCIAASAVRAGGAARRGRAVADHDRHRRAKADRYGTARHGEHAARSGKRTGGAGAGAGSGGGAVAR